jgi:hypothetical protein
MLRDSDDHPKRIPFVITFSAIMTYIKTEPFRPFRIHMVSGKTFDIRHPEMIKAGKTYLLIFTYVSDHPDMVDHWETASLRLIENVSHLDAPVGQW